MLSLLGILSPSSYMKQRKEEEASPPQTLPDGTEPHVPVSQASGYLPIHAALVQVYRPPVAELQTLLRAWPQAARHVLPNGRIALHVAAHQDCAPVVRDLLEVFPQGARHQTVDARLPLDSAIMGKGSMETIELLLAAFPQSLERINRDGQSYLSLAVAHGKDEAIVERFCTAALLAHRDGLGQTILHYAVTRRRGRYVDLILKKAPELLVLADHSGQLPLHVAAGNMKNVPLAILERLIRLHPTALYMPCFKGELPLHKLVAQHPLPQLAAVTLLVDGYPASLRHRNNIVKKRSNGWNLSSVIPSLTPLEVFHEHIRFTLELRHYGKARSILLALLDRTLPLHQMAHSYRCFPADLQRQVVDENAKSAMCRDDNGLYAWQVAAIRDNTNYNDNVANLNCVYELLRMAPSTLEDSRQRGRRTKRP